MASTTNRRFTELALGSLEIEREPALLVDRFGKSFLLDAIQESIGWTASAHAHLLELIALVGEMDLVESVERVQRQISRSVDGESGRFPAAATYRGAPLFLGSSPDGALRLNLYTGYGRRGFPTLPLLESIAHPPKPSIVEGKIVRAEKEKIWLDGAAASKAGVYVGSLIRLEGEGRVHLALVIGYDAEERVVRLADPVERSLEFKRYRLQSRLSNCYLVGTGEVEVAKWGPIFEPNPTASQIQEVRGELIQLAERCCLHLESLRCEAVKNALVIDPAPLKFLESSYSILDAHAYWGNFVTRLEQN